MTLEELKRELESLGKGNLLEAVTELLNVEKERGVSEVQKRNREAQNLRKYKQLLEEAGYDVTDEEALREHLKGKKETNQSDNLTLKSIKAELDRVKAERDSERLNAKRKNIQAELTNAIGDKLYGSKYLINSLISEGVVDIVDNEIIFKQGDEHIDFASGVKKILDDHKDMLKTNQTPGSKTTGSSSNTSKNVTQILASNDGVAIKANLSEIAKELGLKL